MPYRELDHTADILLEITGASIHELFCEAAQALMDTLYPHTVPSSSHAFAASFPIEVRIDSESQNDTDTDEVNESYERYELLVQAFLSEILFLTETEYIVFSSFDIVVEKETVYGTVHGIPFDAELHGGGIGVKGISYSELAIQRRKNEYILTIIYDI